MSYALKSGVCEDSTKLIPRVDIDVRSGPNRRYLLAAVICHSGVSQLSITTARNIRRRTQITEPLRKHCHCHWHAFRRIRSRIFVVGDPWIYCKCELALKIGEGIGEGHDLVGAHQTKPRCQTSTFEGIPSRHLVEGSLGTMKIKELVLELTLNVHLQSHRQLRELVPSRRRERGPCGSLEHAARTS
jgi:hypothetical protein